jgi:hypothetical protein
LLRVLVAGAALAGRSVLEVEGGASAGDAARLRRMDRFGRAGYLAGSLALLDARHAPGEAVDPRSGVVFGSAYGCRDSITDHALLLGSAARVEDLRPSLFAQTVHNTVPGELAIEWRLGGVSEVFVSGRTAGLDALLHGAAAIAEGEADTVVCGGAEGLHARMLEAWSAERPGIPAVECGAALVLAREAKGARGEVLGGFALFESDASAVARRVSEAARGLPRGIDRVVVASPDLDGALARLRVGEAAVEATHEERFGAAGPWAAARHLLEGAREETVLVVVRDPDGPTAGVLLRVTPRSA